MSRYAPSLVSDPRDEMSRFVTGVSDDLIEECRTPMIHDNMSISHLMVRSHQVEETRVMRKSRDVNMARSFDGGSSKGEPVIQDKPRFKKRFSNKVPSKFSKDHDDKVPKPKLKRGNRGNSPSEKPTCSKCCNGHVGECLVGTDN